VLLFLVANLLLGVGLAMDAFSVSCANGLREPGMSRPRMALVAGTYAWFQFVMPLLGWFCVHEAVEHFAAFQRAIPWFALAILLWLGGKMVLEGLRGEPQEENIALSGGTLIAQGVATSIDALSAGFALAGYSAVKALMAALIIAATTFAVCLCGLALGKRVGTLLSGRASVLGGVILIAIGIEIFVMGI